MSFSEDRWRRADELLDRALELEPGERDAFLARASGGDDELRREVEALLRDAEDDGFLPAPFLGDLDDGDPAPALEPGTRVGRYRIVREIGRGGMAVVYLAERADGEFEQQVALKLILPGGDDPELVRRFRRERQILAHLRHPAIAQLIDGGATADGRLYFVLEYVEGEPIDRYCDRQGLDLRRRIRLFIRAARAVEHAHHNLIIHRDIKPSNLLVTTEGEPKLLDFGIAKLLAADAPAADLTQTRGRLLTPAWASPEQVLGQPLTTASDVYQLGLLLYQLLTGRSPYRTGDGTPMTVARAVLEQEPTRPSTVVRLRRELVGDLDNVLLMALRKEPWRRYASVGELIADLERHLDGRPVSARPATFAYRAGKLLRRHAVAAASAAALLVLSALLLVLYTAGLARERDRAQEAADRAEKVSALLIQLFEGAAPTRARGERVTVRELLDRGAAGIEQQLAGEPLLQAEMMTRLGGVYSELALYDEAEALLERALAIRRASRGSPSPDPLALAATLVAAARARAGRADYAAARSLLDEARAIRERELPADDPAVAEVLVQLGDVHRALAEYEAAERLLERALESQRRRLGDRHHEVGRTLLHLARVRRNEHAPEAARELLEQAVERMATGFEPDHPYLVLARADLAEALADTGERTRARQEFERVLPRLERLYGAAHPEIAARLGAYGDLLVDLGEPQAALDVHRRQLAIVETTLGGGHPEVGQALSDLGKAAEALGDLPAARGWFERSAAVTEAALGPEHPSLSIVLRNLALLAERLGEPVRAAALYERILEIRGKTFPPDHAGFLEPLIKLGRLRVALGDPASAEPLLRRAWELGRTLDPGGEHGVVMPQIALGHCLALLDRPAEAEALLEPLRPRLEGDLHPEVRRRLLDALATLADRRGRPAGALRAPRPPLSTG